VDKAVLLQQYIDSLDIKRNKDIMGVVEKLYKDKKNAYVTKLKRTIKSNNKEPIVVNTAKFNPNQTVYKVFDSDSD